MKIPIKYASRNPYYSKVEMMARQITSLSYWDRRMFFAKQVSPKYPRFQYKFMSLSSLDEGRKVNYLNDILMESRLWLSSPLDFNDPFDMSANVVLGSNIRKMREKFKSLIERKAAGKTRKEKKALLDKFLGRGNVLWLSDMKRNFAERQLKTGIFSFAGDPRSILMWSHYADNHTGICLQFEVVKDPSVMSGAIPVDYVDDHPVYDWLEDSEEIYRKILLSKFSIWNYEMESRIVRADDAKSYLPVLPEALVGVILGCRVDDRVVDIVNKALLERENKGLPPIKVYKAIKHPSKYKLTINQ